MKPVSIVGPSDAGKTTLIERLTERLADRGPVATVKHLRCTPDIDTTGTDTARHREAGAAETYGIEADGTWFGTGTDRTLGAVLDDLAPDYEYVLVEGYSDATLPTIALGGRDHTGETLLAASSADGVNLDAAVEAIESVEPYVTLDSLIARAVGSEQAEYAGAIATFTGRVRVKDAPEDARTESLEFERYDEVAAERIRTIREELTDREGVFEVLVHHRTGVVEAGEDVVYVVVLAGHRAEAFSAVEDAIDRVKAEVPLFKKEVTVEDDFWAHER
ncbi:molybdopterin synthase [Halorhabdus sp. CBA1104]|uniref:molybdopterin synthase n=1 Tax=Halorhabdus sp. CBA1104 TaxID=1380432 RepID=UPI0012B26918|nr:molybdopterin synthase [Halorhabdus sp. CBA1104]QGN07950.1 molybdopterin synthase [Halorhabdus sp. CBA1104]